MSTFIKNDYTYKPYSTINFTGPWDPKIVSSDSLFRIFYLVHLVAQLEEDTQVRGIVVIMDFDGLSMKQVYIKSNPHYQLANHIIFNTNS